MSCHYTKLRLVPGASPWNMSCRKLSGKGVANREVGIAHKTVSVILKIFAFCPYILISEVGNYAACRALEHDSAVIGHSIGKRNVLKILIKLILTFAEITNSWTH